MSKGSRDEAVSKAAADVVNNLGIVEGKYVNLFVRS